MTGVASLTIGAGFVFAFLTSFTDVAVVAEGFEAAFALPLEGDLAGAFVAVFFAGLAGLALLTTGGFIAAAVAFLATGAFFAASCGFLAATFLVAAFLAMVVALVAVDGILDFELSTGFASLA